MSKPIPKTIVALQQLSVEERSYESYDNYFNQSKKSLEDLNSDSDVSDEEVDSYDDGEDLKERLAKEREVSKRTIQQMKNLMNNIGEYKKMLEMEKQELQEEVNRLTEENKDLKDEVADLTEENDSIKGQFDKVVEDYDAQIEELQEERKSRTRENVENLQTLIKELTYIEDLNENLNVELTKEREQTAKLRQEVELGRMVIEKLERRLEKAQSATPIGLSISSSSTDGPLESPDVKALQYQLSQERSKIENISILLTQMRSVLLVNEDSNMEEQTVLSKLQTEKEQNAKAQQKIEEQDKVLADQRLQIEKLQKRIKDLHSTTMRNIGEMHKSTFDIKGLADRVVPNIKVSNPKPIVPTTSITNFPEASAPIKIQESKSKGSHGKKSIKSISTVTEEKIQKLFRYAENGKEHELSKLLKRTKGVAHAQDKDGKTALHKAVFHGAKASMVQLLLDNGIMPNIQDNNGLTVLHCAALCPSDNTDSIKLLLRRNEVDSNINTNSNDTVLHYYVKSKHLNADVFNTLLLKCSNLNQQNAEGDTILHSACAEGNDYAVVNLIKHGANPNLINTKGETPLHYASRNGYYKLVTILVDLGGADPTVKSNSGTPVDYAPISSQVKAFLSSASQRRASPRAMRATISVDLPGMPNPAVTAAPAAEDTQTLQAIPNPVKPRRLSLLGRSSSGVFDNTISLTIVSPEMTMKTAVSMESTVGEILTKIRRKFPAHTADWVLVADNKIMQENNKLSDFPVIKETKELFYQSKTAAESMVKLKPKRKDSIVRKPIA